MIFASTHFLLLPIKSEILHSNLFNEVQPIIQAGFLDFQHSANLSGSDSLETEPEDISETLILTLKSKEAEAVRLIFRYYLEGWQITDIVTDKLEFHFYDGTVKTAQIHFFNQAEKKYTDPHKKPFGYQWSNEKGYVIVPKEAEAVKLIFRYYLEGWQITDISKQLEADGYGSIRGKVSRKLVAYVLDSDFYLGIRRIKAQFSESGQEEVIENDHEPLISREMFDAVQKRRDSECRRWSAQRPSMGCADTSTSCASERQGEKCEM